MLVSKKMQDFNQITLFCDENNKDLCFTDDVDDGDGIRSEPLIHLPEKIDDDFTAMLKRETDYLPNHDYLNRLRFGDFNLAGRTDAFDWIFKAHSYFCFGPLSLCLAVNYLDRFFAVKELPKDKPWTVQLLAVACLSIAAKIEETCVPQSIDLQVGDPEYVFEPKAIQRMELLVLDTLEWKMNAITPCSFIDYSLRKLSNPNSITDKFLFSMTKVVNRSMQLVLCTIKGIDYLEFKPSEIAAAVAICVSAEIQAVDIDKATARFIHLEKGRVLKCVEMVKGMSQNGVGLGNGSIQHRRPQSPIGVLDVRCFSYKSDDLPPSHVRPSSSSSTKITPKTPKTMTTTMTITATTATSPETKRISDKTLTLDS
ncbi:cyclin-D4-1-like [Silene latifolia]|uniref:cyclin-D4-1-like n=1 Tax=Silene latifolia TaxID=37657 RepID=UPI003D789A8C